MIEAQNYYKKIYSELQEILNRVQISNESTHLSITCRSIDGSDDTALKGSREKVEAKFHKVMYNYYNRMPNLHVSIKKDYLPDLVKGYRSDQSTSKLRSGWTLEETAFDAHGSILIKKDNYHSKQALAGAYLSDEYPLVPGMPVAARWHITSNTDNENGNDVSPFYEVSGTTLPNDYQATDISIRFYFNLNPEAPKFEHLFVAFFQKIAGSLNRRFVPFQLKVLFETKRMIRSDSAVLITDKRYFFLIIHFIHQIGGEFSEILRDATPMFTYELRKGVGFAEQPPFDPADELGLKEIPSFGQHRSALIAKSIIDWHLENVETPGYRADDVDLFVKFLSEKKGSFGPVILPARSSTNRGRENYALDPVESAFFLNRKSGTYPYVKSYFSLTFKETTTNTPFIHNKKSNKFNPYDYRSIGYKLCSEAIWDSLNRCSWVGFESNRYQTVDNSLVDGLAGIVIFLNSIYQETRDETFRLFRDGTTKCLCYKLRDKIKDILKTNKPDLIESRRLRHGLHKGDLMAIATLKKQEHDFCNFSEIKPINILDRMVSIIPSEKISIWVFDGLSGSLISLLKLSKLFEDGHYFIAKAVEIGEQILKYLFYIEGNSYVLACADLPIGFSFGVSGVAFAFMELYAILVLNQVEVATKFLDTARILINYENTKKVGDGWLIPHGMINSEIWFLGILDITYSRLALLKFSSEISSIEDDLKRCINYISLRMSPSIELFQTVNRASSAINLGLVDLLIELQRRELLDYERSDTVASINNIIDEDNFQFVTFSRVKAFMPSIQSGYAGLGYSLLRMAKPHHFPSILLSDL